MKQSAVLVFRVVMVLMIFSLTVAVFLIACYLVSAESDPYTSFFKRLQPVFYLRAALILLISSLLYIPISYGISYYFLQSSIRNVGFSDIFYICRTPFLLLKALGLRLISWFFRGACQLALLLTAIVAETGIYLLYLALRGESVWTMSLKEFPQRFAEIEKAYGLFGFSLVLWILILLMLFVLQIRFMFCKYALLCYPKLSPWEAFKVGLRATKGAIIPIIRFLLSLYCYYILVGISFGLLKKTLSSLYKEPFSSYAARAVSRARILYFREKEAK